MTIDDPVTPLVPDPHTPKTFGILNIVFAMLIMPCGLCIGIYEMIPGLMGFVSDMEIQQQLKRSEQRQEELKRLDTEIETANDEDRVKLVAERTKLANQKVRSSEFPKVFSEASFRDPAYLAHFAGDIGSSLILNLIMMLSGVGLIYRKSWGRVLAILVCWSKLIRLVVLTISLNLVIAPWVSHVVTMLEDKAVAQDPQLAASNPHSGPEMAMLVRIVALVVLIAGSIYPIVQIWFLSRPSVRAAFRSKTRSTNFGQTA